MGLLDTSIACNGVQVGEGSNAVYLRWKLLLKISKGVLKTNRINQQLTVQNTEWGLLHCLGAKFWQDCSTYGSLVSSILLSELLRNSYLN